MNKITLLYMAVILLIASYAIAADKVVVIPLNSSSNSDKLWGQGRPGAGFVTHLNYNGYCTTPTGIKFALSETFAEWGGAASACLRRHGSVPRMKSLQLQTVTFNHSGHILI